jgi:hypothetical protein
LGSAIQGIQGLQDFPRLNRWNFSSDFIVPQPEKDMAEVDNDRKDERDLIKAAGEDKSEDIGKVDDLVTEKEYTCDDACPEQGKQHCPSD